MAKVIVVKIYSMKKGLLEYSEVEYIHLKSKDYNLMIYEDYYPLIGELNGDMSFMAQSDFYEYKDISGYYIHRKNTFEIILNG